MSEEFVTTWMVRMSISANGQGCALSHLAEQRTPFPTETQRYYSSSASRLLGLRNVSRANNQAATKEKDGLIFQQS